MHPLRSSSSRLGQYLVRERRDSSSTFLHQRRDRERRKPPQRLPIGFITEA